MICRYVYIIIHGSRRSIYCGGDPGEFRILYYIILLILLYYYVSYILFYFIEICVISDVTFGKRLCRSRAAILSHTCARQLVPESYDPKYYELQHGRIQDGYLIKKKKKILCFYEKRAEVIII